jgi:hypothetical protein
VISANEWEPVARAFDGVMLSYDHEMVRANFFGVMSARADAFDKGTGDDIHDNRSGRYWGLSADIKALPSFLKMANVHYMMIKRDGGEYSTLELEKEDTVRYGFTVAGDMMGFDYRATYAINDGDMTDGTDNVSIDASMMDLEVGYSLPAMMNLRVHANLHTDSGDKIAAGDDGYDNNKAETYAAFHYDSYPAAGKMDILGWGNLTYTKVGVSLDPMEDLSVAVDYYMFTKTEKSGASFGKNGFANLGRNVGGDSSYDVFALETSDEKDDLGTELDITVTKRYANNFSISGRYSQFMIGDAFKKAASEFNEDPKQIYIEGKLTF